MQGSPADILQDKGDWPPSTTPGCRVGTSGRSPGVSRDCSVHSLCTPISGSSEPLRPMQEGLSEGKRLRTKRGPSPWAGVRPVEPHGSWREQGQRQGRAGGCSVRSWAMLGDTSPQDHLSLGRTWDPNRGAGNITASPTPKPSKGRTPCHWGHLSAKHQISQIQHPLHSGAPLMKDPPAQQGRKPRTLGHPMYQRPQTQYWGAARIRALRHWRSQTKLRGASLTGTQKAAAGCSTPRGTPRTEGPPLTFPRRMLGLLFAVFLVAHAVGASTAQGGQEQERE